ncbi:YozQ family protein [Halalkalibacter oceani]|uniref:YozQ family protein n=1 Tax=Halalkalibacter oceani TaxID=1653776 RepID=A0A9X2INL2_9BACI|nr:YozQ family protein [Halalkalibacter oceani]MCM3713916.1 YozQ family protein [Halalkalibacter oceani]
MNEKQKQANQVATNQYQSGDEQSEQSVDRGLAMTHEQVLDAYVEGTIDGEIDEVHGEDQEVRREPFKEFQE